MDPQTSIPLQTNSVIGTQSTTEKKSKIPIILLSFITVLLCIFSAYLTYQNMTLKQQIEQLSQSAIQNSLPTPIPTLIPTTTPNKEEPISNSWKTFESMDFKFKIDYPATWIFATNTVQKELDINGVLTPEHIVVISEKDIDTISTYQYGRIIISIANKTNETDVDKWFDKTYRMITGAPVSGIHPSKTRVFKTTGGIKVIDEGAQFTNQKYIFITNNTVVSIDVNYENSDSGLNSSKNQSLKSIYEHIIDSLSVK